MANGAPVGQRPSEGRRAGPGMSGWGRPRPRRRVPRDARRGGGSRRGRRSAWPSPRAAAARPAAGSATAGPAGRRPAARRRRTGRARRRPAAAAPEGGPSAKPAGRPPNMAALRLRRAFCPAPCRRGTGRGLDVLFLPRGARARRPGGAPARSNSWQGLRVLAEPAARPAGGRHAAAAATPRASRGTASRAADERRHVALAALDVGRAAAGRACAASGRCRRPSAAAARKFVRCVRRLRNKVRAAARRAPFWGRDLGRRWQRDGRRRRRRLWRGFAATPPYS